MIHQDVAEEDIKREGSVEKGTESPPGSDTQDLYLDLLKKCLTRYIFGESLAHVEPARGTGRRILFRFVRALFASRGLTLVKPAQFDRETRALGRDRPAEAETMIGLQRLDNLERCIKEIVAQKIPGDLIEAGVWRGGAAIFMKAVLKSCGDSSRCVWLADSFEGLPKPNARRYAPDTDDTHWKEAALVVSESQVRRNFDRYSLLDDQIKFLPGWFSETLVSAPISQLALIRIDADMYGSTIEALTALYPKLSIGGFVIVDDYGGLPGCRQAVDDFRAAQQIRAPLQPIDWTGVFWCRTEGG